MPYVSHEGSVQYKKQRSGVDGALFKGHGGGKQGTSIVCLWTANTSVEHKSARFALEPNCIGPSRILST